MFCLQSLHVWFVWIKVHPLFCLTQFYQYMFSVRPFFEHFFPFSCHLWRTMIQWWSVSSRTSDWEILPNVVEVASLLIENNVCSELTLCESFEDIKWHICFLFPQAVIKSDQKSVLITLVHLVPVLWKGVKTRRGPWSVLDYSVSKDLSANKIFEHRTLWWSDWLISCEDDHFDQLGVWWSWQLIALMSTERKCQEIKMTPPPTCRW